MICPFSLVVPDRQGKGIWDHRRGGKKSTRKVSTSTRAAKGRVVKM